MKITEPQLRLLSIIKQRGEWAEYWPVVNDWVKDQGRSKALALHNINRTVNALVKLQCVTITDDGMFHLTDLGSSQI